MPSSARVYSDHTVVLEKHDGKRKNKIAATPNSKNMHRLKRAVFIRDNFTCQACGKKFKMPKGFNGKQPVPGLTLGHIIPRGIGGRYTVVNLKAECNECNNGRGMEVWTEFI